MKVDDCEDVSFLKCFAFFVNRNLKPQRLVSNKTS